MKRILCLLICMFALYGASTYAFADGISLEESESTETSSDPNSDTSSTPDPTPAPNPTPSSAPDSKSDPVPLPDPPPEPKPISSKGITTDSSTGKTVINLATMKSVSFNGTTATFLDSANVTIIHGNGGSAPINTAGYVLTGIQGNVQLEVSNFTAPVTMGSGTETYTITFPSNGNNSISAQTLTVYGNLYFPSACNVSGKINVSGQIISENSISFSKWNSNDPNETMEVGSVIINSGHMNVNTVLSTTVAAVKNGNVVVSPGAVLTVNQNVVAPQNTGYILAKEGSLDVLGTIKAATFVQAATLKVSGMLQAGTASALNGDMTVSGKTTVASASATGRITVEGSGEMVASGAVSSQSLTLLGGVNVGSLSSQTALELPGSITVSGEISAPSITVGGTVSAGSINSKGDIYTSGNLSVRGRLTAQATLTFDNRARVGATLSAGEISVAKLSSPYGGLSCPGTILTLQNGADINGLLEAKGGSANGLIKAQSIKFYEPFTGTSLTATGGSIDAQALTLRGNINARDNITLHGRIFAENILTTNGDINVTSVNHDSSAAYVEAQNGTVTLDGMANVSNRTYGKKAVTIIGGNFGSIVSESTINLRGNISTTSISAGPLNIDGYVTTSKNVTCTIGTVSRGSSLKAASVTASGALAVSGYINSTGTVRGNPVTTPNGGTISASQVIGKADNYKGALTIYTPYGSRRSIYLELQRSGDSSSAMNVTTDSQGRISLTSLQGGSYTVYIESGSNSKRGTVSVPNSGGASLDLRSNAGSGTGGGSGGGSNSGFNEDNFWDDVSDDIRSARRGDTVRISASKANSVPVWILEELEGRPITLKLTHGRNTITINGENMYRIPNNRIFYNFDDLSDLYKIQPSSSEESSSSQPSSNPTVSSSQPSQAKPIVPPAQNPAPAPIPTPVPNPKPIVPTPNPAPLPSIPSDPENSLPEFSEPEEESRLPETPEESNPEEPESKPADTKEPDLNVFPVIIAVSCILLSVGGLSVAYLLYRKKQEGDQFYDEDDR